jgi:hypothetical protein
MIEIVPHTAPSERPAISKRHAKQATWSWFFACFEAMSPEENVRGRLALTPTLSPGERGNRPPPVSEFNQLDPQEHPSINDPNVWKRSPRGSRNPARGGMAGGRAREAQQKSVRADCLYREWLSTFPGSAFQEPRFRATL